MATRKNKLAAEFCRCVKKVRKTIQLRPGVKKTDAAKEAAAIGVCVKSVLQTRGKTLKRFRCGKKTTLTTQKPFKGGSLLGSPVADIGMKPIERDPALDIRSPPVNMPLAFTRMKGGAQWATYQSTDPTASKIQPGAGIQSYYENAVKAPVRL